MSSSVKTIRLTVFLSALLLLLTYLVTVNIEIGLVSINSGWISNNFFLTVFGGAFGSTVPPKYKRHIMKKVTDNKRHLLMVLE